MRDKHVLGLGRADAVEQFRPSDSGAVVVERLGGLDGLAGVVDAVAHL
ncbi:hypothetical protein [Nocardia carnea]|uniref:Uncharacterized protein n=1 Tax=Nocardia carnea TaxID=37328 RepID=A0ABW7TWV8_9NOCA|nr:hypothetical protein [Nocardia carnea]